MNATGAVGRVNARPPLILVAQSTGSELATHRAPVDFDAIPATRKQQLNAEATRLLHDHGHVRTELLGIPLPGTEPTYRHRFLELDYHDFKALLTDLKNNRTFSDNEKAFIWSQIAEAKGASSWPDGGFHSGAYRISLNGVNPSAIDSEPFRAGNTPRHTIAPFFDPYHGFGRPPGSGADEIGLGYYRSDTANRLIVEHETPKSFIQRYALGFNRGDATASRALVAAFHAYRDTPEGHRFEAFANTWIRGIVER